MVNKKSILSKLDKEVVWHPYTPWNSSEECFPITEAKGAYLYDENKNAYLDAISSWWVTIHGHSHPYIAKRVYEQFLKLDHVIFAGFTHAPAVELAQRLISKLPPGQEKVFFSDNGSTAVEVAMKIAVQFRKNKSEKKHLFVAFENAYHGDTFGAMSVSAGSLFTEAFSNMLFEVRRIPLPIEGQEQQSLDELRKLIQNQNITAFIFEPLVLGAGGMLMYSASVLDKMIDLCHEHNVLCIADEVMTGFGRTGSFFASDKLLHSPDIFCLSKGITGGVMPLGVTAVSREVFAAFKSEQISHTLWHGHSFTANPLACAAACASLDLFENDDVMGKVEKISQVFVQRSSVLKSQYIKNVRTTGCIAAIELQTSGSTSYANSIKKPVANYFFERGVIVRPLGNVVYFLPPFCITIEECHKLFDILEQMLADNEFIEKHLNV